jgi:hypothetical protein
VVELPLTSSNNISKIKAHHLNYTIAPYIPHLKEGVLRRFSITLLRLERLKYITKHLYTITNGMGILN